MFFSVIIQSDRNREEILTNGKEPGGQTEIVQAELKGWIVEDETLESVERTQLMLTGLDPPTSILITPACS